MASFARGFMGNAVAPQGLFAVAGFPHDPLRTAAYLTELNDGTLKPLGSISREYE
jgi:hypothetical protein